MATTGVSYHLGEKSQAEGENLQNSGENRGFGFSILGGSEGKKCRCRGVSPCRKRVWDDGAERGKAHDEQTCPVHYRLLGFGLAGNAATRVGHCCANSLVIRRFLGIGIDFLPLK